MSLQGTLDTFALPDVLRLLAATRKTGHLRIDGSRGAGDVWVDAGDVVAARAHGAGPGAGATEVVFELLRFPDGSFSFDGDVTTSDAGAPAEVEPLLEQAENLLREWRDIEAVVPSLDARVLLTPELPRPTVAVSSEQWRLIVSVAGGSTVGGLGAAFNLGELDVSRAVKDLVEAGLVVVDVADVVPGSPPPPAPPAPPPPPVPAAAGAAPDAEAEAEPAAQLQEMAKATDAPELAKQLAELSPEAARAVVAAASAETPEERDAALATLDDDVDGEPINRGLLLKFLSSVRS